MKASFKLAIINIVIIIFSCTKDETSQLYNPMPTIVPEPMAEFFTDHKQPSQTFQVSALTGGAITGTKGMEFTFPSNSFVTASGAAVTGSVDIQLKEFNTKGDFILNKVFTVSDGRPLESGGAYELKVLQNGNELKLATGKTYTAQMVPGLNTSQMYVYNGVTDTDGSLNWVLNQNANNNVTPVQVDTITNTYSFVFTSDHLNYINCDQPYDTTAFTQVNGTLPDSFSPFVLAIDNNAKMAIHIYTYNNTFEWNFAPTGRNFKIVAMYEKNGVFHLSIIDFTNNGQTITLPAYQVKTESEILSFIESL